MDKENQVLSQDKIHDEPFLSGIELLRAIQKKIHEAKARNETKESKEV